MRALTNQQRLRLVDAEQLYENWLPAQQRLEREFRYGLRWKRVRGKEYLF